MDFKKVLNCEFDEIYSLMEESFTIYERRSYKEAKAVLSDDDYADFINNINSLNPQQVADQIMQKALENNGGIAKDDMTIIVAKVFSR